MQQFAFNIIDERGRVKVFEAAHTEAEAKLRLERRYPTKTVEPNYDIPLFLRESSKPSQSKHRQRAAA